MKKPLSEIVGEIEKYVESEGRVPCFTDLHDNPFGKADKWAEALEGLEFLKNFIEEKKAHFSKKLAMLKKLEDDEYTFLTNKMVTTGLNEVIGDNMRGLKLYRNPQPALHFHVPIQGVKYSYTLPESYLELAKEYPEFLTMRSQYVIDAEALKKAIIAGRKFKFFADVEYGHHVRPV